MTEQLILSLAKGLDANQKADVATALLMVKPEESIPLPVFSSTLSGLEAITAYLKDQQRLSIKDIAARLNRRRSTIYNTYRQACAKRHETVESPADARRIPIAIFADRTHSILESLTHHLRDTERMGFTEMAKLTAKSPSTLRTVYWRYNKKRDNKQTIAIKQTRDKEK